MMKHLQTTSKAGCHSHAPPIPGKFIPLEKTTFPQSKTWSMQKRNNCRIITPKEAKNVFQRAPRTISRKMSEVRAAYNKVYPQPVTVKEFCNHFKLDIEDVYAILGWDKENRNSF